MTSTSQHSATNYPLNIDLKGQEYLIREMAPEDGPELLLYARSLPQHDILYMRRDITQEEGIQKWLRDLKTGRIFSFIALKGKKIVGYSSINLTNLDWTRHVGDLRVSVAPDDRECGLGRVLVREAFNAAVALNLEVVTAHMTPDQTGARTLFEELGFRNEAVLKDYVKDRNDEYHDMLIMAVNVDTYFSNRNAYGLN